MSKSVRRTVKRVIDGDTFQTMRKIGNSDIVRIANVNAPEKWQFGGTTATNRLRGLIGGQTVTVNPVAKDRYGRVVAKITHKRKDIGNRIKKRR